MIILTLTAEKKALLNYGIPSKGHVGILEGLFLGVGLPKIKGTTLIATTACCFWRSQWLCGMPSWLRASKFAHRLVERYVFQEFIPKGSI